MKTGMALYKRYMSKLKRRKPFRRTMLVGKRQ